MKREETYKLLDEAIMAIIEGDTKTLEEIIKTTERETINNFKETIRKKGFKKTFKSVMKKAIKEDRIFLLEDAMCTLYKALKEIEKENKGKNDFIRENNKREV